MISLREPYVISTFLHEYDCCLMLEFVFLPESFQITLEVEGKP
jgi:hypothetical protein